MLIHCILYIYHNIFLKYITLLSYYLIFSWMLCCNPTSFSGFLAWLTALIGQRTFFLLASPIEGYSLELWNTRCVCRGMLLLLLGRLLGWQQVLAKFIGRKGHELESPVSSLESALLDATKQRWNRKLCKLCELCLGLCCETLFTFQWMRRCR